MSILFNIKNIELEKLSKNAKNYFIKFTCF